MTARAIWKGNIHFGAIDIPVKLHPAIREERIQFHLLHKKDHIKLKQQMFCAYEKVPVPPEEQTRGFKLEDGKYVIIDRDDLERAKPKESRIIEVHEFVKSAQINPIYFSRTYYLEPDIRLRGYQALVEALGNMDLEGICSWTMRKISYIASLQMAGRILRLNTLRYHDEVIPVQTLELQNIPLPEKELQIGNDLINHLSVPFQPQKFENEHQKKLQYLIDKKARGEKIAILRPRRLKPTSSDKLLHALEESLKKVA
jgi:DNA end-binding protein Ku